MRSVASSKKALPAIYVTHDQSEAMALSDNIIIMKKKASWTKSAIRRRCTIIPADEFVADFIGESNFLHARHKDKIDADTAPAVLRVKILKHAAARMLKGGSAVPLFLRPEPARLAPTRVFFPVKWCSRFMGHYQTTRSWLETRSLRSTISIHVPIRFTMRRRPCVLSTLPKMSTRFVDIGKECLQSGPSQESEDRRVCISLSLTECRLR